MTSTFPMSSTDYDIMLQDVSNHLSRSQLLRRLSTHSSSTSGSGKIAPARITKQNSAGNSPHNVQRRRTTANTARTYARLSQKSPYQTQEQILSNYHGSRQSMPMERPMSWHPGSEMISTPATQVPTSEPVLGNTIAGLQNLAVSGQSASSVQQSIENAFSMGYGFPISRPLNMYEQSPTGLEDYEAMPESMYRPESLYTSEPMHNPYPYNTFQQYQHSYMPHPPTQDTYPPASYQVPQWPEAQPCFANDVQDSQAMADLSQWSSNPGPKLNVKAAPQVLKRANKVLSGIGLYDDKAPDFVPGTSCDYNRDSIGKGLKLEETWQPPKDDDENDDDDDDDDDDGDGSYSTDEAEEIEEDPPIMASAPQHAPTAFYPTYGDLSNQSFFFTNDDDPYTGEDQYANYLAFGQPQSKPQDPATGNFLWC
ncbi:MAG: hypothetical protein ASARMPREDX12_003303 [Alectoria sarmentosa]|nr:MAG: hypothetical protein ASARMPREDX12_003303 [Alectoria sarmentosa]CAD6577763.1 MAG: hypothetical protein ASARMPRED_008402 [Alectoria sarmentosa]